MMQALAKSPSSLAVRSKGILSEYLRCRYSQRVPVIPCPAQSSRLLGTFFNTDYYDKFRKQPSAWLGNEVSLLLPHTGNVPARWISSSARRYEKEPLKPSSKVEETVKVIKEKAEEAKANTTAVSQTPVKKPALITRIWHELVHYYHGFRLLFIDINVSRKLLWRILNGKTLSRREHKLLVRTVGDVFRLLPFSVFIIVPFMELLLPLAIKFFPGMLPSTFQTATERDGKLKQSLKVRLEMAKFLQTTLDEMSVQSKGQDAKTAMEFTDFFRKIRTTGEAASTEEILKFSKLFEDEITLDSLSRQQLTALCRVLDINTVGMTSLLRFQIRMKLRSLVADDKMIQKEGLETLTITELQQACQARGMRAYGVSEDKLRAQLKQWLDLSLNEKVPPSLLLLSRALMLPEGSTSDQLKATISALPDAVELKAAAAINEREGVIDNKSKIQLIKEEEQRIKEERAELREARIRETQEQKEVLTDSAPIIGSVKASASSSEDKKDKLSSTDIEALEDALDTLGQEKKTLLVEKEELDDLKEELQQYKEDVQELNEVLVETDSKETMRESKAAQNLFKKVNNMIGKMDVVLQDLEEKSKKLGAVDVEGKTKPEEVVRIDELMDVIKRIQKVPDDAKLAQISDVLGKIDDDRDGAISVEEVLKVIELIGKENVQLTTKQLDEILQLLEKEETLELENQIEKALEKTTSALKQAKDKEDADKEKADKNGNNASDSADEKPMAQRANAMSVKSNGNGKTTISEPKLPSNGPPKQL